MNSGLVPSHNSCVQNSLALILAQVIVLEVQVKLALQFCQIIVRPVQFRPERCSFEAYAVFIEKRNGCREGHFSDSVEEQSIMTHIANKATPMLPKALQPPLSYPGAPLDADRAKSPRLAEPPPIERALNPGDRVEGLGNFGVPTGELGTVEKANEDDVLVKWDDDGRMRIRQPWLKKVLGERV